jgi:hypothetical protein
MVLLQPQTRVVVAVAQETWLVRLQVALGALVSLFSQYRLRQSLLSLAV